MGSQGTLPPPIHVFMISFPGQGHVNPLLRLGKLLAAKGILVTFSTTESHGAQMKKANKNVSDEPTPYGSGKLRFQFFDDAWDYSKPEGTDLGLYMQHLESVGTERLNQLIEENEKQGRPVSCLINNPFIPWVSDVAETLGIPSAVLWVQSAASFSCYYHYLHKLVPFPTESNPELEVQLPAMPLLKHDEIPNFLHPFSSSRYIMLKEAILGQFKKLSSPFCILMDTFQELELELVEQLSKICPIKTVGPLFKHPKLVSPNGSSDDFRGDLFTADSGVIQWLDSKPISSVVYISFGSIVTLKQEQVDEMAYGLLNSGLNFLWVMKEPYTGTGYLPVKLPDGFLDKAGDRAKIVQWCPQEQVLAHPSLACFLTHCGWNSTMESLAIGTPIIAFPQWGDQVLDAKYLVDVFKVGIRMCRGEDENRIIPREEVENCVREATSGAKAAEMKENALKWKKAAEDAVAEGGSSQQNLQAFIDDIMTTCNWCKKSGACNKCFYGPKQEIDNLI
ncbi:gallate 1-beta-glucosyltransferase 84A23-like [Nicotiana sylvestris]|uniref:Glycosyltransferase n=1 Tax=Nicotiana sylvestris TaxID=4096 RepID=A0A1U7XH22_NICSY|nr:PREDICTED: cinnamate beta-D-glucosyltransferase-like [Nicotiana sylvestris]